MDKKKDDVTKLTIPVYFIVLVSEWMLFNKKIVKGGC